MEVPHVFSIVARCGCGCSDRATGYRTEVVRCGVDTVTGLRVTGLRWCDVVWIQWLGYGLQDCGIVFRFPAGSFEFSVHKTFSVLQPSQVAEWRVSRRFGIHFFWKNVRSSLIFCIKLPCHKGTLWKEAWCSSQTLVPSTNLHDTITVKTLWIFTSGELGNLR
jgi:hypothetical protein